MPIKRASFVIKGMSQDLAESKFNPQFAFENKNLRITASKDSNTYVLTTERGNKELDFSLTGTPLGCCEIDNDIVVFTHVLNEHEDHIYLITPEPEDTPDSFECEELYSGPLNFSSQNPIETIAVYESSTVKKVYWTDGLNQPRFINVAANNEEKARWQSSENPFDFIPILKFDETIRIDKQYSSASVFAPGVIQYFFTYYNNFGQESNIFYSSPLYYTTKVNKGASPDSVVGNIFNISISNCDTNFSKIRIYSLLRTSIDAVPEAKKVVDLTIPSNGVVNYVDNGLNGETIDPYRLFYVGGQVVSVETFTQKDNTLFLGNIKNQLSEQYKQFTLVDLDTTTENIPYEVIYGLSYNNYFQLNNPSDKVKGFMRQETYRLGYQLQDKYGIWSNVVYIDDVVCDTYFSIERVLGNWYLKVPRFTASFSQPTTTNWFNAGYRKVRPVIVFPSINERSIICQGVVNPTLYNVKDRYGNVPYTQASWFFRPQLGYYDEGVVWKHDTQLPINNEPNAEIQSSISQISYPVVPATSQSATINSLIDIYKDAFFIDESIVTLNSPDLEFNKDLINLSTDDIKFRIVGYIPIHGYKSKYDIQVSTAPLSYEGSVALGFTSYEEDQPTVDGYRYPNTLSSANLWKDYWVQIDPCIGDPGVRKDFTGTVYISSDSDYHEYSGPQYYQIYPWHKSGAINNSFISDDYASSDILKKRLINYKYSLYTKYLNNAELLDVEDIKVFDSNEVTPVRLKNQFQNGNYINYLGNVNTTVINNKYRLRTWHDSGRQFDTEVLPRVGDGVHPEITLDVLSDRFSSNSPVQIKYKSAPHAVIVLSPKKINNDKYLNVLPGRNTGSERVDLPSDSIVGDTKYFWDISREFKGYYKKNIQEIENGSLLLGEFYRDAAPTFGGTSEDAILNNKWEVGGKAVIIDAPDDEITITWTEGDTYYQRYDCLKTSPLSSEDKNSVIDILSFMCETRVNLDGRYDTNRGVLNTNITSENFNLINPVYSQHNNFFTYRTPDKYRDTIVNYPNVITWSTPKTYGEEVDSWANVTLTSTLELDGNKGEITALRRLNDNIIAFQDTGISQILYNENVALSTTSGVPIEIANSGRIQGKRYISNHIGCSNKWSICETSRGLYFIDSNLKDIYLFNGQIKNLSESLGMHTWVTDNIDGDKWSLLGFTETTQYDKTVGDVLFITRDKCLAFNENINTFTSLYDYQNTPFLKTSKNKTLSITRNGGIFLQHEGEYNVFFKSPKSYYTTLIVNQEPTADKIFNNVQFRGDCFNGNTYDYSKCPFDTLETSNEYQSGTLSLVNTQDKPSSLKKKFRTWYTLIPRDSSNHRDRMRNPWLKVTLSRQNDIGTDKAVIHDIAVDYFA